MRASHIRRRAHRTLGIRLLLAAAFAACATPAAAQLDPLLFVKKAPPHVIVVVDTSFRMLDDGSGNYHDPFRYPADALSVARGIVGATHYRRVYRNLRIKDAATKYEADTIAAVASQSVEDDDLYKTTRLLIAKKGIEQAVLENTGSAQEETTKQAVRWGLLKLRQATATPAWRTAAVGCDKPVAILADPLLQAWPGDDPAAGCVSPNGQFGVFAPSVTAANRDVTVASTAVVVAPGSGGQAVLDAVRPGIGTAGLRLVPAGMDTAAAEDRPLYTALQDARAQAIAALNDTADANSAVRNAVIVVITGGGDGQGRDIGALASTFASVSAGGRATRRLPLFVIGVKAAAQAESTLHTAAQNSSGRYFSAQTPEQVAAAINLAVQAGYSAHTDFDRGRPTEFLPVSPIVGTVNLVNAKDATGATLPQTELVREARVLSQRSNVLVTAGFAIGGGAEDTGRRIEVTSAEVTHTLREPGFDGRVRAFRVYRPEENDARSIGYDFVKDGSRLWPDLEGGRPEVAGLARTPADPARRNIYTHVPGVGTVPFSMADSSVAAIAPHLGQGVDPALLIPFVRQLPIGAVIGSTPALMDPPSLDPPPDDDYGSSTTDGTYAATYRDRRALLFFGANDGMIHAVDARTGYEVWAFIPFNLLPKLRTLMNGQPVHQFEYFVDSSPKIAEVKIVSGGRRQWRSLLIIGEGPGGTAYQAFDVTRAGMDGPAPESDDLAGVLATFASPDRIKFLWSFPDYAQYDTSYKGTLPVTDGTPGGRVTMYGDLRASATYAEKTVGFTWSDPAVGALNTERTVNAVIVGSGYFPPIEDSLPGRGNTAPRAGRTFYLLDFDESVQAGRGVLVGNSTGAACTGTGCYDVGAGTQSWKNALQADPTAAGDIGGYVVKKAYLGDLAGRYWRFNFGAGGAIGATSLKATNQPIYASSALMTVIDASQQYAFFATGSDLLPRSNPEGNVGPYQLFGILDGVSGGAESFTYQLEWPSTQGKTTTTKVERPSTSPSVAGDIVFFTTTVEDTANAAVLYSRLYAFTYTGGAAYDANGDGYQEAGKKGQTPESPLVKNNVRGRATAPFIVDQHLYFGTSGPDGATVEAFGDPRDFNNGIGQTGVRILSWRELR